MADRYAIKVNGYRLTPLDYIRARDLPDGTEVIVQRLCRDFKTYAVTEKHWYRAELARRKTVGGPLEYVRSSPNADWPEIPVWQQGWIDIVPTPGYLGFYTAEKLEAWEMPLG